MNLIPYSNIVEDVTSGIIAHGVNCGRVMGSGLALQIKEKWPQVYADYRGHFVYRDQPDWHELLGDNLTSVINKDLLVVSCFTQVYYGKVKPYKGAKQHLDYEALKKCLLSVFCRGRSTIMPVHLPKIGCGLAGGDWIKVKKIIEELEDEVNNEITYFKYKPLEINVHFPGCVE